MLSATLIGARDDHHAASARRLCSIRFGGDDDGTWAAADVADVLRQPLCATRPGSSPSSRPRGWTRSSAISDVLVCRLRQERARSATAPVPKWRPQKTPTSRDGTSFLAYAIDGETSKLKKMAAVRNTPVGEVWIETGGVAYTATQLTLGTLTDATIVALPIILVMAATAFAAMVSCRRSSRGPVRERWPRRPR